MLNTHILCRNHLTVEHHFFRTILLIILLNESKNALNELLIVFIRRNLQTHELSSLYQSIDTNSQILAIDIDIACVEQRKHTM